MIKKYRKNPVIIEAVQFDGDNVKEIDEFCGGNFHIIEPEDSDDDPDVIAEIFDYLHSTWVGVKKYQWIIKGSEDEFYPCDTEVFDKIYSDVPKEIVD